MNPEFNPELASQAWRNVNVSMSEFRFEHRERKLCPKCNQEFVSRKLLKKHLAEVHSY